MLFHGLNAYWQHADLSRLYSEDFRLAADDVRCFPFLAGRRFCPCFLQTHVNRRVDDGATFDLSARKEHELAFVKDALGRHLRFVVHRARSIDRIGKQIKRNFGSGVWRLGSGGMGTEQISLGLV